MPDNNLSSREVSHTPGPWAFDGKRIVAPIPNHVFGGQWLIADVVAHRPGASDNRPQDNERDANARLIAAAPEMYEALKKIAQRGNFDSEPDAEDYDDTESAYGNGMDVANWEAAQIARAALARAEGRTA